MNLYIFNPETDLALAYGDTSYTPGSRIRSMVHDLAALPLWFAPPGSALLLPDDEAVPFVRAMSEQWGLNMHPVTVAALRPAEVTAVFPWGWNRTLRHRLLRVGLAEELLPSEEELHFRRECSSRTLVAEVLSLFGSDADCGGVSVNLTSEKACEAFARSCPEGVVFKSPWSGSGKGLCWCRGNYEEKHRSWCRKVLREQGLVTAQPVWRRTHDFAMEFFSDGTEWRFAGYSLFTADARGAYEGNLLLSDAGIEEVLGTSVPVEALHRARRTLLGFLQPYACKYRGYMGVDMMTGREAGSSRELLHPCVEMNWRMNMGVLSHRLTRLWVADGVRASFQLKNYADAAALQQEFGRLCARHPLCVENGRVTAGILPLTPVTATAASVAFISAG